MVSAKRYLMGELRLVVVLVVTINLPVGILRLIYIRINEHQPLSSSKGCQWQLSVFIDLPQPNILTVKFKGVLGYYWTDWCEIGM